MSIECWNEDEMVGWHHRLNGHEFGWTPGVGDGQGGLACCSSWGRKESDMTEQLNWTECWNGKTCFSECPHYFVLFVLSLPFWYKLIRAKLPACRVFLILSMYWYNLTWNREGDWYCSVLDYEKLLWCFELLYYFAENLPQIT